jgi:glycosyltransferase involved in cell wall biosynthesis
LNNKLISVILPTRNREELLGRALSSVLWQTYENWECIVVDDSSHDNTYEIVKKLNDKRIRYVKNITGKGASASRNIGINLSNGKFLAFLDSDDEWLPGKLEKQFALLKSLPASYGMIYCWMDYYDGEKLLYRNRKENRDMIFPDVLTQIMTGGTPTLLLRKDIISETGGFDERMINGADQDFIRRIAQKYLVDYIPEVLVKVYINHSSESRLSDPAIKENNRNFISSLELTLNKFEQIFVKRPDLKAYVYSTIAYYYALLGEKKNFFKYNIKAWFLWPFRGRIKSTLRGIKILRLKSIN